MVSLSMRHGLPMLNRLPKGSGEQAWMTISVGVKPTKSIVSCYSRQMITLTMRSQYPNIRMVLPDVLDSSCISAPLPISKGGIETHLSLSLYFYSHPHVISINTFITAIMQVNPSSSLPLPRRILDVDSRDIHELRSLLEPTSQAHSILDQIAADEALDVNDVCLPPTFPTSVQQCLTTYVPPMFNLPDNDPSSSSVPAPRSLTSTNLGRVFMNTPDQAITVRDSPQLKAILEATVTSAFTSDPTRGRSRLRAWRRTYTSAWEIMPTAAIPYEDDQSGASLLYLATPVNDLLGDLTSYTDESSPPHPPPKWSRPSPKHRIGVTDWVCHSGTTSVGVVEWERQNVLTDSDIGSFATFARQYGVRNAFQVKVSGGAPISHPRGLLPNASKALLQVSYLHFYN